MKSLGEFESVFKRALRKRYDFGEVGIQSVLLISDLPDSELIVFDGKVRQFLEKALRGREFSFQHIGREDFNSWADLESALAKINPDLIVSYRLLKVSDERITTSLGVYIDTLSQKTNIPILVLPNPHLLDFDPGFGNNPEVLVATEHLYNDHSLLNYAAALTPHGGKIILAHIEDRDTFEYYMEAISRIPEINTDQARKLISTQLLADSRLYLDSAKVQFSNHRPDLITEIHADFGHLITVYGEIISENDIDLLVFQTKDDTQLAMHSLGYSLAIEFREVPVLLI